MNKDLEYATVKWFDPQKRFGRLYVEVKGVRTGEELFFHFGDGRWVDIVDNKEVFTTPTRPFNSSNGRGVSKTIQLPLKFPISGDRIFFVRAKGSQDRPKASPWCFVTDAEDASMYYAAKESLCDCGHKAKDHAGNFARCMMPGCHCGDEAYEREEEEYHEVNLSGNVRGFTIYE